MRQTSQSRFYSAPGGVVRIRFSGEDLFRRIVSAVPFAEAHREDYSIGFLPSLNDMANTRIPPVETIDQFQCGLRADPFHLLHSPAVTVDTNLADGSLLDFPIALKNRQTPS